MDEGDPATTGADAGLMVDQGVASLTAGPEGGIHHICYRVADLDAALRSCRERGYNLVDQEPRIGAGGCRIAFIHPKSTSGILVELTE